MNKGALIEQDSFNIIKGEMTVKFTALEMPIVQRVIHATGDFDFERIIRFHPEAIKRGCDALKNGLDIFVDVKMVEAGINKILLDGLGGKIHCHISDEDVAIRAKRDGLTRAEASVDKVIAQSGDRIGIVAIGNAPTALLRVMELIDNGSFSPALVIGVPVGFVSALESKELLNSKKYPFITCLGRKGGSPIAVSIINALMKLI
jgi:precorrin-8X/cobalt-precorrin-8 methylmutase